VLVPVTRRLGMVTVAALVLTAATDYAIYFIGLKHWRMALVVLQQPAGGFEYHGQPTLSWPGVAFVAAVLLAHAFLVRAVVHPYLSKEAQRLWFRPVGLLFLVSAAFVAVVDPAFLQTVLPSGVWQAYSAVVARCVTPLERIYHGWAYGDYLPWITTLHGVLVALLALWLSRRGSAPSPVEATP